jgi:hypothetical protein
VGAFVLIHFYNLGIFKDRKERTARGDSPCGGYFIDLHINHEPCVHYLLTGLRQIHPIHHIPETFMQFHFIEGNQLREQYRYKLVYRGRPKYSTGSTIPEKLTHYPIVLRCGGKRRRTHNEINAETYLTSSALFCRKSVQILLGPSLSLSILKIWL